MIICTLKLELEQLCQPENFAPPEVDAWYVFKYSLLAGPMYRCVVAYLQKQTK